VRSNIVLSVEELSTHLFTADGVVRAVDNVSLRVHSDEMVGFVGESGCGKTMTALSILRLEPSVARIISGRIYFDQQDIVQLSHEEMRTIRGSRIAMIFQDPMTFLNPVLRIGDQVAEGMLLHQRVSEADARERVLEIFEQLGIPSPDRVASGYPHQLSGGMRQRVLIAMAISCSPKLLIADEPTTALDVTIQAQIMEVLKQIRSELKNSLLLITHDLGLVAEYCDRVYVMYAGEIVEHADIFSLFENPRHPYTLGLLNSNLSPDKRMERFETIEGEVPNLIHLPSGCRFHPRCKYRLDICHKERPPAFEVCEGHAASCWLAGEKLRE
jgi:oligopeptide/dipeptide ABC transporter ATP-binding protein